jgi:hypothetical protein
MLLHAFARKIEFTLRGRLAAFDEGMQENQPLEAVYVEKDATLAGASDRGP